MSVEKLQGLTAFEALGMMVSVCAVNGIYSSWSIDDIGRYFMTPIALNQYSVFVVKKRVVGFITWAFLSEELSLALKERHEEPTPDEWQSGQQLWFMDMVAIDGYTHDISRMLQQEILRNATSTHAYALRRRGDGSVRKVAWFPVIQDKNNNPKEMA